MTVSRSSAVTQHFWDHVLTTLWTLLCSLFTSVVSSWKYALPWQLLRFSTSLHGLTSGMEFQCCLVVSMQWHSLSSECHMPSSAQNAPAPWSASPHLTVSRCHPLPVTQMAHPTPPHMAGWLAGTVPAYTTFPLIIPRLIHPSPSALPPLTH